MDEIEAGFNKIVQRIEGLKQKDSALSDEVRQHDGELLGRMAATAIPVIKSVGIALLKRGKEDTKKELYDAEYYPEKMLILGKTDPAAFRPDNPSRKVDDQFCVISAEGKLYELMYSSDGFVTDSYLSPIDPNAAIELYGYDIMFMLYRAMHEYLKAEEDLIAALEKVISYIFAGSQ
jgi:hypothetical protein